MKNDLIHVGETHSFSRSLARKHGINAAILLAFLANRIAAVQITRNDNLGYYISIRELAKHYPYLTKSTINYTLSQLRARGVVKVSKHNQRAYDKTLWYTFADPTVQRMALEDPVRFNVGIATHFGVEAALILTNLKYWIEENRKTDSGYTWHRVSTKKLAQYLPITERTIRRSLATLSEGPKKVLNRKRGEGFDQAYSYSICCSGQVDWPESETERPISEIQRPELENHWPDSTLHRPDQDIHRPNQRTNTYYIDTVGKTSVWKNDCEEHIQNRPAAPFGCVCVSKTLACGAGSNTDAKTSAASISASGQNSGQDAKPAPIQVAPSNCASRGVVAFPSSADLTHTSCSYSSGQDLIESYADKSASPYADKEEDANLTSEQKVRVFKAAIRSLKSQGNSITYNKTSFVQAHRFFEMNPAIPVKPVLSVLESCLLRMTCITRDELQVDGYDKLFYIRRASNLSFFFKHLDILSSWGEESYLAGALFLNDEELCDTSATT